MAKARTAWGIDVGQCALKAMKLGIAEGEAQVEAFDIIEHPKILSEQPASTLQEFPHTHVHVGARRLSSGSGVWPSWRAERRVAYPKVPVRATVPEYHETFLGTRIAEGLTA